MVDHGPQQKGRRHRHAGRGDDDEGDDRELAAVRDEQPADPAQRYGVRLGLLGRADGTGGAPATAA
jgi:hypothetical protein